MEKKIIITDDGSHSLFVPELNENYHSTHGAWNEAMHVFIEMGFKKTIGKSSISILEIGFGTGLNTMLTAKEALDSNIKVKYCSLEKYPLSKEIIGKLNFASHCKEKETSYTEIFHQIHQVDWEEYREINSCFQLKKMEKSVLDWETKEQFDLIYFDAFAPEKQPEMWSDAVFKKMYDCLKSDGFLTTYCAKGIIKRRLKSLGFRVENVPGPPGKREMTLAYKN